MSKWTADDKDTLLKLGAFIGNAEFKIKGEEVIPLYKGIALLSRISKVMSEEMKAEQAAPEAPPPPPPADVPAKKGRRQTTEGRQDGSQ